jgi:hypothetical protein
VKSFSILRTNVGLTTNIKVMVDSSYNLSLDSIESNSDLSLDKYKKVKFIKTNYYDELIPYFYKNTPSDIAFDIKYDGDVDAMYDDFSKQYDEIYQHGARNIINNKNYTEEFEYFAPLYIGVQKIPSNFIIFRVDGPGVELMTKENFITDISNSFKTVKLFSLGLENNLGQWVDINFKSNKSFPHTPLEMDFRNLEFCKWNGIDYQTGGYISKSLFMDDILDEEKEIYELEKFIFNNYSKNKVVFPNIINFSFLFDDEPANPDIKRKWSLNRYYGFYLDKLERVKTISPYITPFLKNDVEILDGNVLHSPTLDPFSEGWSDTKAFYVEYNGDYYKVEKFTETLKNQIMPIPIFNSAGTVNKGRAQITKTIIPNTLTEKYVDIELTKYRIISDLNLTGKQSDLNKNYGIFDSENAMIDYDGNYINITDFDKSSIWLIEINGIYHNLYRYDSKIKMSTDYSFTFNLNDYSYKVAGVETKISTLVNPTDPPKKFSIYKASFTDIKDFDTRIVDTEYSKYEYEKSDELTETDETKMYMENPITVSNPKDLDDFIYKGEVIHIPVASEYTANYETFKLFKNELSDIWRKNSVYCRWSFQNSLSANDYPYSLNNSFLFEDFNRTVNPFNPIPNRSERNLDYFYTLNSSTASYLHHSLHIEGFDDNKNLNTNFRFELDKYLNIGTYSLDYFTDFFYQRQYFLNGEICKNVKKYSEFNSGDSSFPNITLFRGLKFFIYDVNSVEMSNEGEIDKINLSTSDNYDGYKFSILLSDNDTSVTNIGSLTNSNNTMDWSIIDEWKMDKIYASGSSVLFNDILYKSLDTVVTNNPVVEFSGRQLRSAPYNEPTKWNYMSITNSIFWDPVRALPSAGSSGYNINDFVYHKEDYYSYINGSASDDFWSPFLANSIGYNIGETVLYKGRYYCSLVNDNRLSPDSKSPIFTHSLTSGLSALSAIPYKMWTATQSKSPKWSPIELWNPIKRYVSQKLLVHNEIIYLNGGSIDIEPGEEPGISTLWTKKYSLEPDTDFVYPGVNPIVQMNGSYYLCNSNTNESTLDNGINIYVNKKWKNILININISDNTYDNITNSDRDDLYTEVYEKLTALNFTRSVNDIDTKYGFTDYVNYIIINEDGTITKHNYKNNLKNINCLIKVDEPDELKVKVFSLTKKALANPKSLKSNRYLINGKLNSISQLNWYSDVPYSMEITENKFEPKVFENYHSIKNIVDESIWRHSGYYMPTFYDVQLFDKNIDGISDNTRFDIDLSEFGIMKERKIQKINRKGSILKLKNEEDLRSVYPMLDEFGYSIRDFFIFSTTWDLRYYYETITLSTIPRFNIELQTIKSDVRSDFGQPTSLRDENRKNLNL